MKISLRRFFCLLLSGIVIFIVASACSRNIEPNVANTRQLTEDCRVVQHTMGETCIPREPRRVVTLRPDHLANSLALDIQPIASAFYEGFPLSEVLQDKVDKVESVGDFNNPSLEKILLLKPDLIISNSHLEGIYPQLSQIAPTVVLTLPFPPPSWKEQLEELAQILDKQEIYEQLIANYWQRIENLKQALGSRRRDIEVSLAGTNSGHGIWAYGAKHPVGEILNDLGLQRPPLQRGNFFYLDNISEEKLSDIDGDILFLGTGGDRDKDIETRNQLRQKSLWQKLKVVQQEQVYIVDSYWHNAGNVLAINAVLDDLEQYLVDSTSDL